MLHLQFNIVKILYFISLQQDRCSYMEWTFSTDKITKMIRDSHESARATCILYVYQKTLGWQRKTFDRFFKYQTLPTRYLARWSSYINLQSSVVKLKKFWSVDTECPHPICSLLKSIGNFPTISSFGDDLFPAMIYWLLRTAFHSNRAPTFLSSLCKLCSLWAGDI